MSFSTDAKKLIDTRKFEELEALWMAQIEGEPGDVDELLTIAKQLRKAEERARADALLGLLGDVLKDKQRWPDRLKVIKEIARLAKQPGNLRKEIEEALTKSWGHRASFKRVMANAKFSDPASNPVERAEKVELALQYDEGECFFMAGRGAGVVTELNPDLGVCRLDFDRDKRVSVPLGAAQKHLVPLPPGHVLREKIENPDALVEKALGSPSETLARLLQSFGRAMSAGEVKDAMIGVVPDNKWTSWWTAARKNPQIVVAGAGAKATYSWTASTEAAADSIRREFAQAAPRARLELAKKHSARSTELANQFSSELAATAAKLANTDPALAWEIAATLEKLPGKYELSFEPSTLLSGPVASRAVSAIPDRQLRERALQVVRETHPDWQKVYSETFFIDEEPKVLSLIVTALEEAGAKEIHDRLIDETLRYPRRHPRAFYWYCKTVSESDPLPQRAGYPLLFQLLDATTHDEFAPVKARLREFFDKGSLAVRIITQFNDEEHARKVVETIERYGSIEDYRRETVKTAAFMKHPALREPQAEPIYATAEALSKKREELDHLRKVEIPANSKALQVAREMGDLRENFEYKAARQRAEYLSSLVAKLSSEISRVRVLNPDEIDTSVVRIGTRIVLTNGDVRREVTILGPWESAPEQGVYSNQSEAAKALLGKASGDLVAFMGNDYQIEEIRRWNG